MAIILIQRRFTLLKSTIQVIIKFLFTMVHLLTLQITGIKFLKAPQLNMEDTEAFAFQYLFKS